MIDFVKRFFVKTVSPNDRDQTPEVHHDIHVAVCALCIEMARIDNSFTPEELDQVINVLQQEYQIPPDHVAALMETAEQELAQSVDLWQFAHLINEHYSIAEKLQLIEILWKIVYVDHKMDRYEHYLMNKVANLLRLSHSQLIEAKLKVLHSGN